MLTPLYSQYAFLHVSALKGPSSGSPDTFCEQGDQNICYVLRSGCQTAALRKTGHALIRYLNLDTYFGDPAHKMYPYTLRMAP